MVFDFSMGRTASAWLLIGLIAAAAGCSSEPDKGAGSSGSGAVASSGKPPISGDVPSAGTSSSALTFPSDSKPPEFAAPDTPPPIAPPAGPARGPAPVTETPPITAPPDLPPPEPSKPEPASSGAAKSTAAPLARQPGDPIFAPPERPK